MPVQRPLHQHTLRSTTQRHLPRTVAAALGGALVLGAAPAAYAYRPFDGTDAEVAESASSRGSSGRRTPPSREFAQLTAPWLVLNLGIWPRFELVLETNNLLAQRAAGGVLDQFAETHAFVKAILRHGFVQEQTGPSIAVEAGPWLPNPERRAGVGGSANFIFSIQIERMILHLDLMGAYRARRPHPGVRQRDPRGAALARGPAGDRDRGPARLRRVDALLGALRRHLARRTRILDVDLAVRASSTDQVPIGASSGSDSRCAPRSGTPRNEALRHV